ncbi:hypothetical protein [Nocardioides sp. GCM10030258]|uniref:hypothetical protein n=1 Tax=unclassified Nocardioides TaxID=2615069 RepID=UPI003613538B
MKGIDPSWWTWSFLIAAVVFMVISAWLSLRTISPKQTALPGVNDLTDWREQHLRKPQPGTAGPQVAESLLLNHYVPDTRGMHGGFDSKGWPASTS